MLEIHSTLMHKTNIQVSANVGFNGVFKVDQHNIQTFNLSLFGIIDKTSIIYLATFCLIIVFCTEVWVEILDAFMGTTLLEKSELKWIAKKMSCVNGGDHFHQYFPYKSYSEIVLQRIICVLISNKNMNIIRKLCKW